MRGNGTEGLSVGTSVDAELTGIGRMRARVVGRSGLGLHVEFAALEAAVERALRTVEGLTSVGNANLFYANDEGAGGYVAALEKNPIWKTMPAVKEGRAHAFPARVWGAGGPRSCAQAIDAYVDVLDKK